MDLSKMQNQAGPIRYTFPLLILLLVPLSVFSVGSYRLTILHTSDFRSRYGQIDASGAECTRGQVERGECFGGIARLINKVQEIKAEGGNVLLLDGGNQFEATPWFAAYREKASVHFMNITGYDAMAIGYREFDLAPDGLSSYIKQLPFPVLSSNIDVTEEPALQDAIVGNTVINVGGEDIGIVGYTYGEAATNTKIGAVRFTEELEGVRDEVAKLQDRGINKVILLGTSTLPTSRFLAAQVPGVDVVIGGGTRTFLYNGDPPSTNDPIGPYPETVVSSEDSVETVLVAETIGYGKYLGRLDVNFDKNGHLKDWSGNPILLGKTVSEDADIKADVDEWEFAFRGIASPLGSNNVFLDGSRKSCRLMECTLGNVITDAMVMTAMTPPTEDKWTEATVALMNSGAIRASMPTGKIFTDDMARILPYKSTVDMMSLQGQYIKDALEHSVAGYNPVVLQGRFLQLSGLRVIFDLSKPDGQRVQRVSVLCSECLVPRYKPLEVDEVYKVLVSSFLANGGDGYKMISENKIDHSPGISLKDAVRVYVKDHSPLVTPLEGRIRFLASIEDNSQVETPNGNSIDGEAGGRGSRLRGLLRPVLELSRDQSRCADDADVYPPNMDIVQKI